MILKSPWMFEKTYDEASETSRMNIRHSIQRTKYPNLSRGLKWGLGTQLDIERTESGCPAIVRVFRRFCVWDGIDIYRWPATK